MKKISLLANLYILTLLLSGCRVNWFDRSYDVPWYVVAVPAAIILILAHIHIMSGTYICPSCGTEIKPKWYHLFTYVHNGDERVAKCPKCGRTGFCKRI